MFILGEVDHVTKCSHAISDSGAAKAIYRVEKIARKLCVLSVLTVYDESVRCFYKKERTFRTFIRF